MRKRKQKLGEVSYSPKVDGMIDSVHTPIPARLQHRILTMCSADHYNKVSQGRSLQRESIHLLYFFFGSFLKQCSSPGSGATYSRFTPGSKLGYSWAKWYSELYYSRNITLLLVTKAIASLIKPMILCIFFIVSFLAMKYGIQDFSSPTRDWTRTSCSGSSES